MKNVIVDPLTLHRCFSGQSDIAKFARLFKEGNPHRLDNFGNICLHFSLSKSFEKVVFQQVYSHLTNNNLFHENQYGFRKNHPAELAGVEPLIFDWIAGYLDTGEIPIFIFLDLSKTFDTLDSSILNDKLQCYGFSDIPLKWFYSYLKNKSQCVVFKGIYSVVINFSNGVPQGCIYIPYRSSLIHDTYERYLHGHQQF